LHAKPAIAATPSLQSVAVPPLSIAASPLDGATVELLVQSTTGAPLNTDHANRVELIYSSDVQTATAAWIKLDQPLILTNQILRARIPPLSERTRFIKVRVNP